MKQEDIYVMRKQTACVRPPTQQLTCTMKTRLAVTWACKAAIWASDI